MGDRTGSREPKLSSLKKSKKNPGAPSGRVKKAAKAIPTSTQTLPPPLPRDGLYFDCGVALLSRQFDRDRDRVITRAQEEGVAGLIAWFSDIEKQQPLADICKTHSGFAYFMTGIHADNIDRTNKKSHESWIEKVEELSRKPECVGIISGLNLTRDIGTHFPQEAMLRASCVVASKVMLPLILMCPGPASLERTLEILKEESFIHSTEDDTMQDSNIISHKRALIYDPITACGLDVSKLTPAISLDCGFIVSAAGLTDEDAAIRAKAKDCVKVLPLTHIISCTDSPWRTPQNIPDTYLRTLRNESCNIMYVNHAIAAAYDKTTEEYAAFSAMLLSNVKEIFGLDSFTGGHNINHTDGDEVSLQALHINDDDEPAVKTGIKSKPTATPSTTTAELKKIDTQAPTATDADEEDDDEQEEEEEGKIDLTESYYGCIRCRTRLFGESQVARHAFDTNKTVFKVGEEG